jgi:hypothetical protein
MQVALLLSVSVAAAVHPVVATLWLSAEVRLRPSRPCLAALTGVERPNKAELLFALRTCS